MSASGPGGPDRAELELELRLLPGVVSVATGPEGGLTVEALDPGPDLAEAAARAARLHSLDAPVQVVDLGAARPRPRLRGRVVLQRAIFDPVLGASEVHLSHHERRGSGRSASGPVVGAVEATLAALDDLGMAVPFYLFTAGPVATGDGAPTMVVLRPRGNAPDTAAAGERIGVARGASAEEAASRATLSALNRFLTLDEVARTP